MLSPNIAEAYKASHNYFSAYNQQLSTLTAVNVSNFVSGTELFWLFFAQLCGSRLFTHHKGFSWKKIRRLHWKVVIKKLISLMLGICRIFGHSWNQVIFPCLFSPWRVIIRWWHLEKHLDIEEAIGVFHYINHFRWRQCLQYARLHNAATLSWMCIHFGACLPRFYASLLSYT